MRRVLVLVALVGAALPATAAAAPFPLGAAVPTPLFAGGVYEASWSHDGTRIAYSTMSSIVIVNRDGSGAHTLPLTGSPHFHEPALSPDGTKIAYFMFPGSIQVADSDGTDQLTIAAGRNPAWSPDGQRIVYADATERLRIVNADGTGDAPVGGLSGPQSSPAWSPDGSTIAYTHRRDSPVLATIRLIGADGSDDRALPAPSSTLHSTSPSWSPDGRYLAFESGGLFVSDTTSPTWVPLLSWNAGPGGPGNPEWSPDGDTMLYAHSDGFVSRTSLLELDYALSATGRDVDAIERSTFTGTVATFTDADPRGVPADHSAGIEWGDGTASAGTIGAGFTVTGSHRYAAAGTYAVTVTIKDRRGASAVTSSTAVVGHAGPPPPPGPVGVSIDRGAQFTNSPHVRLALVWPAGTTELIASNDGGFGKHRSFAPEPSIRWKLASSGPERLPKTVYVRFGDDTRTFQDDIILDQTRPELREATYAGAGRLRLRARDAVSGLARVQAARKRSKPRRAIRYRRVVDVARSTRWVRVQDRAGNRSAWRRVTR
jgi:hypothetical protein